MTYAWAFGDDTLGSGAAVTHTYASAGTYTAVVTASNSANTGTATTQLAVTAAGDVAISGLQATNDSPTTLGQATTLTATVGSGTGVSYSWAFGDGDIGSGAIVVHTHPDLGTYMAVVTSINSINAITATTQVTVTDSAISGLNAASDSPMEPGRTTTLTATVSAGTHISYTWAFW